MEIVETEEYSRASQKNGKESTDALIAEVMESDRYQRYQNPQTRLSILKSALARASAAASDDAEPFNESVFIFGGTDNHGTGRPVDYYALRKDGSFTKVSTFKGHIEAPCKCNVKGVYSAKWGSVTPDDGGVTNVESKSVTDCLRVLNKRALTVKDMEKLESLVAYGIYAFKGEVQWVNGTKIFTTEGTVAGENTLMCADEHKPPRMQPTLAMVLNGHESGFSITLNIPRQRVGQPVISIEDFVPMVQDAMAVSGDIKEQTTELKNLLYGREIIGIGTVGKIKEGSNNILYINCACGFIAEMQQDIPDAAAETLVDVKEVAPACIEMNKKEREEKLKTPTKKAASKQPEQVDESTSSPAPDSVEEPAAESKKSENKDDITGYVSALVEFGLTTNNDPKWLPVAKARATAAIPAEIDDDMVKIITKRAGEMYNTKKAGEN